MAALLNESDARAELGGLGRTKLYELTSSGDLSTVKIGRRRMWLTESLHAYVAREAERTAAVATPQVLPRPVPERIRAWRESSGLTREALAVAVGASAASVAAWETGRSRPNSASTRRLAEALGIPATALCTAEAVVA